MVMNTLPKQVRTRKRRGNEDDYAAVRGEILDAAFGLIRKSGGLSNVTMRNISSQMGLSTMGLYRYFTDKTAVLQAMWARVLQEATLATVDASHHGTSARDRLCHGIDALLRYWEAHPEYFVLVYMTDELLAMGDASQYAQLPAYSEAMRVNQELTRAYVEEVGGDVSHVRQAHELRIALVIGYLHSRLMNRRYPWQDYDALRRNTVRSILVGIEACVTESKSTIAPSSNTLSRKRQTKTKPTDSAHTKSTRSA